MVNIPVKSAEKSGKRTRNDEHEDTNERREKGSDLPHPNLLYICEKMIKNCDVL